MVTKNEITFKNQIIEEMLEKQSKESAMLSKLPPEGVKQYYKSLSLQDIGKALLADTGIRYYAKS